MRGGRTASLAPSCAPLFTSERSCRVFNYTCVMDGSAPYYITIGDAGNREGLAEAWVDPQPAWSLYRQASYGHGVLTVHNATHATWEWEQNPSLVPAKLDSFDIIKGVSAAGGSGVTGTPRFASSLRGGGGALPA